MLENIGLIILGVILLSWSAERFIASVAILAKRWGIAPLMIGIIIVGFGTSLPELIVSIIAATQGSLGLPLGNAIGSNITNIGLVIGVTALVKPLAVQSTLLKREFPVLFIAIFIVGCVFYRGQISRIDGAIMVSAMAAIIFWFAYLSQKKSYNQDIYIQQVHQEERMVELSAHRYWPIAWAIFGLIMLPVSSEILVHGAVGLAQSLGVSDVLIGLSVVAIGTSLPELAAALMSIAKNEPEIAIGNILGSNLFNLLAVLGVPAIIHPLPVNSVILHRDYPIVLGLSFILFLMCFGKGMGLIKRWHGLSLCIIYVAYICALALPVLQR